MAREVAALLRHPVYRGQGVAEGKGQPVLLVPGFLAGDDSLGLMTKWLRHTGHYTASARMRLNINCSAKALERLEERAEVLAERQGQKVAIIGQSRGGCFARVLARRRPDLVSGIVTLGSPLTDQMALHPIVKAQVIAVGALGTIGVPGLFGLSCLKRDCCETFDDDLQARFPKKVGFVSLYSQRDGVVEWEACLDDAAECVEIDATHIGMGLNPGAYREIGHALARFRLAGRRGSAAKRLPRLAQAA